MNKYIGFVDHADMRYQFRTEVYNADINQYNPPDDFPNDAEVLIAMYGGGSYDGTAFVLFERDGKLYEVNGSHCSCYGLEGQWGPEETSKKALEMRQFSTYDFEQADIDLVTEVIDGLS